MHVPDRDLMWRVHNVGLCQWPFPETRDEATREIKNGVLPTIATR